MEEDPRIATWVWTRVEIASAVERRVREGRIDRDDRRRILERLDQVALHWDEVVELVAVARRACTLLARHPLRAADAGQLAAALHLCGEDPGGVTFVSLDLKLREAAEKEGLRLLPLD